jgi:hypothetical protein
MPRFLDHHPMPNLPPGAMDAMRGRIERGEADEFGVTPKNVYAATSGNAYCVSDAADAGAVIKAHAAMGVTITAADVDEVSSLV